MPAKILVGTQWGDEGKGKVADNKTGTVDAVVRYQGGNNTGKTVVNEYGKTVLHTVPSGIFRGKICVIERGVVIHPPSLVAEMDDLIGRGVSLDTLKISPFAHLVMPWHIVKDRGNENGQGTRIGTTGRGIGPCYQEKMGRKHAIRVAHLLDGGAFLTKLEEVYKAKQAKLKHFEGFPSFEEVKDSYLAGRERILPYIADTFKITRDLLARRKMLMLEGAQAILLDVDYGTYEFVTSSNTGSAAAVLYTGIPYGEIVSIIGVLKAYDTRVGFGPFPTEYGGNISEKWCNDPSNIRVTEELRFPEVSSASYDEFLRGMALRRFGNEYGASTGRPRRCGRLDLPLLRYSVDVLHATELALTKLDVLGMMERIEVCVGYEGVSEVGAFEFLDLHKQKPIYEEIDGWGPLGKMESREDLPPGAQKVIDMIEKYTDTPVTFISTGPERNQFVL